MKTYLFSARISLIDLPSNFLGDGSHLRFAATINKKIAEENIIHNRQAPKYQYEEYIKLLKFPNKTTKKIKLMIATVFKSKLRLFQKLLIDIFSRINNELNVTGNSIKFQTGQRASKFIALLQSFLLVIPTGVPRHSRACPPKLQRRRN